METIALQNSNSKKLLITAAYYAAFITLGFTVGAVGPVLPTLAKHTGTALDAISAIFVVGSLGYMAGTWIGGRLYDRIPGHLLAAGSLVIASLMLFFIPSLTFLWLLAAVMGVLGFFQGWLDVGVNTLLLWLHGSKVGPFMNGLHFFFGLGAFLAPIAVAQLTGSSGDIRWVYWIFALLNIPIALWILLLPAPGPQPREIAATEQKLHASPGILALLVAFFFLYVGVETGYGNWLYTYATTLRLADAAQAAYLTSVYWGMFTLFRLIGVWISTRVTAQKILVANFIGSAIGLGIILLIPGSQLILWVGTVILGASIASTFPAMLTLMEQRLHLTGSVTGWSFVGSGVGQMVLPWLIGQLFVPLGAHSMMAAIMVDLVINVLILGVILRRSKGA